MYLKEHFCKHLLRGLAYHKMKTMMLFSANYSALKREEATQTGGSIIRDVVPIGGVLSSFADAYGVPVPYTSGLIPGVFRT
ncbi:hypothetical protein IX92_24150 [Vibrio coralliilyticus]|uniref:Uncharacterized protein n=1 Tax=Vibrio coralliilyticus TaxID=190893 RepID=A0AAN0SGA5_9VIBR|nr:hypothetical protein IX92_24150 [Vibrio coralliilyticus]